MRWQAERDTAFAGTVLAQGKSAVAAALAGALHRSAGDEIHHGSLKVKSDEQSDLSTKRINMEFSDRLLAVTMRLEHCLALFPEERGKLPQRRVKTGVRGIHGRGRFDSLSLWEREKFPPRGNNSPNGGAFAAMENRLPLPGPEPFSGKQHSPSPYPSPPRRGRALSTAAGNTPFGDYLQSRRSCPLSSGERVGVRARQCSECIGPAGGEARAFAAPVRLRSATARSIIRDLAVASERRQEWLRPRRRGEGEHFPLLTISPPWLHSRNPLLS